MDMQWDGAFGVCMLGRCACVSWLCACVLRMLKVIRCKAVSENAVKCEGQGGFVQDAL